MDHKTLPTPVIRIVVVEPQEVCEEGMLPLSLFTEAAKDVPPEHIDALGVRFHQDYGHPEKFHISLEYVRPETEVDVARRKAQALFDAAVEQALAEAGARKQRLQEIEMLQRLKAKYPNA